MVFCNHSIGFFLVGNFLPSISGNSRMTRALAYDIVEGNMYAEQDFRKGSIRMVEIGYALSSEEHSPNKLLKYAQRAEDSGFTLAMVSDHYHPWLSSQGNSAFAWSVLGGIAATTKTLRLGTAVTAPIMRYHPAIIAQAAATIQMMSEGRFILGVGTGEYLNEHILGDVWPEAKIRIQMLDEAIDVLRQLWTGEEVSFYGEFYVVDRAKLYSLPENPPPIYYAAAGDNSAEHGGEIADGFISTAPKKSLVQAFDKGGGSGKPKIAQATVCYADTEDKALDIVYKYWRQSGLPDPLSADLTTTDHFEAASKLVTKEDIRKHWVLGPDSQPFIESLQKYIDAGFEQVVIHDIGPDQESFLRFAEREIIPHFQGETHKVPH